MLAGNNHTISVTVFSMQALSLLKIGLPNLDFHQFSYRDTTITFKKASKRSLYTEYEENC